MRQIFSPGMGCTAKERIESTKREQCRQWKEDGAVGVVWQSYRVGDFRRARIGVGCACLCFEPVWGELTEEVVPLVVTGDCSL